MTLVTKVEECPIVPVSPKIDMSAPAAVAPVRTSFGDILLPP
jgi:hypothetical protein